MKKALTVGFLLLVFGTSAMAEGALDAILADEHTVFFIAINALLTLYFVAIRFDRFAVVHGPEILTTMGIFGCFFGIALALLDFNTNDVQNSVPSLLSGVKTAFWASVSGVFGSLVIRARHKFQRTPIEQTKGAPKSSSLDDVVTALNGLRLSIAGTEQETLISQLKLSRQEQADGLKGMRQSLDEFAQEMAEQSSRTLVEALRDVIKDFNAKINEQFGENFKQLNEAVGQLLVWQENYKQELQRLQETQAQSVKSLKEAAENLAVASNATKEFGLAAAQIYKLSSALTEQVKASEQSQQNIAALLAEFKGAVPQFEQNFKALMSQLESGVKSVQDGLARSTKEFSDRSAENLKRAGDQLTTTLQQFGAKAAEANETASRQMTKGFEENQKMVSNQLDASLKKVVEGVDNLEKGLEAELNRSLMALGNQLASLSAKFVADYSPLTSRLTELVRLSESVALPRKDAGHGS